VELGDELDRHRVETCRPVHRHQRHAIGRAPPIISSIDSRKRADYDDAATVGAPAISIREIPPDDKEVHP
jgi:hypothetical protein